MTVSEIAHSPETLADAELVAQVRRGHVEAFATLIDRYQAPAVRLATLITRDAVEAEDVAQDAFIKAFYAIDRFNIELSFRAWLLRIVANEARNSRSAAQRRSTLHTRYAEEHGTAVSAHSAEDSALTNAERIALLLAIDTLREDDRMVLAYRYLFDMSEAEMAQALGCQRGTVKSRLARALGRTRDAMRRVAPLVVLPADVGAWFGHAWPAAPAAPGASHAVSASVLHHIAAGGGAAALVGAGKPTSQNVVLGLAGGGAALAAVVAVGLLLSTQRSPTPPEPPPTSVPLVATPSPPSGAVVYGGDLSDAQRQVVQQLFGTAAAPLQVESVSRADLVASLQAAGTPTDGSERAISSAMVTCEPEGSGLHVQTLNISDIPAAAYASTLVTAGIADATVVVAAPPGTPMTGETALAGVLRAYPQCHGGDAVPGDRLRLAYDELRLTRGLADATNDWELAAATMLGATQNVIASTATDQPSVERALDQELAARNLNPPAEWRNETVAMLGQLGAVEHGPYGRGYQIQQVAREDVKVRAIDR
jgi:RNA polymerase sigma factor (sigma-70 family)